MSDAATEDETLPIEQTAVESPELPITLRIVLAGMGGGFVGMILMLPVLVGVPELLNLFRTEPIVEFANIGAYVGLEPTLALGVALFVVGGTTILPLMFVVVGAFLPPREPRYLRGATFATLFWTGFVLAFWPGGDTLTIALFLGVSLVAHWVYGSALGFVLDSTTGIPQHRV